MGEIRYRDSEGEPTDDPASAVQGEVVEYGPGRQPRRVTRFFLREEEIPWLPVSEAAMLLWVLVVLIAAWLGIGFVLGLI